jgi:tetratricopeptide (TPR) repeat protein
VDTNPDAWFLAHNEFSNSANLDHLLDALATHRVQEAAAAHHRRGLACSARGDLVAAVAEYDAALTLNPDQAEVWYNRAVARYALGNLTGALTDADRSLELNPHQANAHNARGAIRREAGDLSGALTDFDEALRLHPDLAAAYNNRGATRYELGDLAGALTDFDEALRLQPNNADLLSNRGAVRAELGDLAGAGDDCRCAETLAPANAHVHARRGVLLHEQRDFPAAVVAYDRALEINPRLFCVYLLRGNARYHGSDWRGLRADYQTAFAQAATRSASFVVRALRKGLQSDPVKSLQDCEDHLQRDPEDAMSLARRGLIRILLRRDDEAEEDFAHCRRLCPESAPYLDILIQEAGKPTRVQRLHDDCPPGTVGERTFRKQLRSGSERHSEA